MASQNTTKVRLFLISDTHAQIPTPKAPIFRTPLPKCDILIHAGDLTNYGTLTEYEATLSWITKADAELKIVIAGNHDVTLDVPYYTTHSTRFHTPALSTTAALDLWTNPTATDAGIFYMTESTRTFRLRDKNVHFKVHASPYQPEYKDWAFNYPHSEDRYNPLPSDPTTTAAGVTPVPDDVDILVTHGPSEGIQDTLALTNEHAGCPWLLKALERVRPRLHVFGHVHEGFGATRVQWGEGGEEGRKVLAPLGWTEAEDQAEGTNMCAAWGVDVSIDGEEPLAPRGEETLCVNASLVAFTMKVIHGGVLVDMELPIAEVDL